MCEDERSTKRISIMARSQYIYVISAPHNAILSAFTVKYECKRKIERDLYQGEGWTVTRINDGGSDDAYKVYSAREFLESKP